MQMVQPTVGTQMGQPTMGMQMGQPTMAVPVSHATPSNQMMMDHNNNGIDDRVEMQEVCLVVWSLLFAWSRRIKSEHNLKSHQTNLS